jgi:hypothetical protein
MARSTAPDARRAHEEGGSPPGGHRDLLGSFAGWGFALLTAGPAFPTPFSREGTTRSGTGRLPGWGSSSSPVCWTTFSGSGPARSSSLQCAGRRCRRCDGAVPYRCRQHPARRATRTSWDSLGPVAALRVDPHGDERSFNLVRRAGRPGRRTGTSTVGPEPPPSVAVAQTGTFAARGPRHRPGRSRCSGSWSYNVSHLPASSWGRGKSVPGISALAVPVPTRVRQKGATACGHHHHASPAGGAPARSRHPYPPPSRQVRGEARECVGDWCR